VDCDAEFEEFVKTMDLLGPKLGPLIFQFPSFDRWKFPKQEKFLTVLTSTVLGLGCSSMGFEPPGTILYVIEFIVDLAVAYAAHHFATLLPEAMLAVKVMLMLMLLVLT